MVIFWICFTEKKKHFQTRIRRCRLLLPPGIPILHTYYKSGNVLSTGLSEFLLVHFFL